MKTNNVQSLPPLYILRVNTGGLSFVSLTVTNNSAELIRLHTTKSEDIKFNKQLYILLLYNYTCM